MKLPEFFEYLDAYIYNLIFVTAVIFILSVGYIIAV